jgi:hypothetical protein
MKKSHILGLLIALVALAVPATASASPDAFQWTVSPTVSPIGKMPNASTAYTLSNPGHGKLGYGWRVWGINLEWGGDGDWKFMRANERDHRTLGDGETVALYNTDKKQYLAYTPMNFGIDMNWQKKQSLQWKISRNPTTGKISLHNTVINDDLVYGPQTFGINLNWRRDVKDPKGPTTTNGSFTVYMRPNPPTSGFIPWVGSFGGGVGVTGTVNSVQNPNNDVTLLFIKPGHSSTECGSSSAVVQLGAGQTMTSDQRIAAFGSANPRQPVTFVACAVSLRQNLSQIPLNITYTTTTTG